MTCHHCCEANKHFDSKTAVKQLKTYRKKGSTGTTKKILSILNKIEVEEKQLLDIGGGIGALQWEFLKRGGKSTLMVEASSGYIEKAKSYAAEKGWQETTRFIEGDFNDFTEQVDTHDFVTLDKVICCYPYYEVILENSIKKTGEYLALSYPISNWISISLNWIGRTLNFSNKTEFRSYIHPVKKIREFITNRNLQLKERKHSFPWIIEVYQRV